jgi:hypothetical protein
VISISDSAICVNPESFLAMSAFAISYICITSGFPVRALRVRRN